MLAELVNRFRVSLFPPLPRFTPILRYTPFLHLLPPSMSTRAAKRVALQALADNNPENTGSTRLRRASAAATAATAAGGNGASSSRSRPSPAYDGAGLSSSSTDGESDNDSEYTPAGRKQSNKKRRIAGSNLSKYSLSATAAATAVGTTENLAPTHHLNQMEGYASVFLGGLSGISSHDQVHPLSSSSAGAGPLSMTGSVGRYPVQHYSGDRHDLDDLFLRNAGPGPSAARRNLDRAISLATAMEATVSGASTPHQSALDPLSMAVDGMHEHKSRGRGRYPTPTHIMVPAEDGTHVSLDQAVDFLVDATIPLSPQRSGGGGSAGAVAGAGGNGSVTSTVKRQTQAEFLYTKTKEFKRLKNSDAAKRSRLRKALRLDLMESAVNNLETKNAELKEENEQLKEENRRLLMRLTMEKFGEDDLFRSGGSHGR